MSLTSARKELFVFLEPDCYHTVVRFESPASRSTICKRNVAFNSCFLNRRVHSFTNLANSGHVEEVTQNGHPPQEVDGHREESAEQQYEAVGFDEHSDQRIAEQNDQDSAEECNRSLDLVLLEKEPERPLQPYHAGQSAYEKNLGKRGNVKHNTII